MSNKISATKVVTTCLSKKESKSWRDGNPINTEIVLEVTGDNGIYYHLSGGTGINLNTVNQDAADLFEIGGKYAILISKEEENKANA